MVVMAVTASCCNVADAAQDATDIVYFVGVTRSVTAFAGLGTLNAVRHTGGAFQVAHSV